MKKRILAVVLAVFTILGLVPIAVMTGAETITKFIDPVDPSLGGSDVSSSNRRRRRCPRARSPHTAPGAL